MFHLLVKNVVSRSLDNDLYSVIPKCRKSIKSRKWIGYGVNYYIIVLCTSYIQPRYTIYVKRHFSMNFTLKFKAMQSLSLPYERTTCTFHKLNLTIYFIFSYRQASESAQPVQTITGFSLIELDITPLHPINHHLFRYFLPFPVVADIQPGILLLTTVAAPKPSH